MFSQYEYSSQPHVGGSSSQPNVGGSSSPIRHFSLLDEEDMYPLSFRRAFVRSSLPSKKYKRYKYDIMESVISCEIAEDTWTDLIHSFEGPSDTKENRIMDLKLEYQTFKAKPSESLSQTYTRYKTLLNELANDDVNLSKHEINVSFMNCFPEKWLIFSQGLRNANHTQTLGLADIYERFVYEDKLIQRRYSDTKKALITTPSNTAISTAFFSNNVVHDFQENSDDKVSDDEEVTQVKVLMALADDELTIGKNHARNGEWIDITMRKLDAVTFQIQNTKLTKLNHALKEQLKEEKKINEKWLTSLKKVSQCINEQILHQKKKVLGGELFTESSLKINENENHFIPASMGYDHEMVPKSKDWVERLNPDRKLLNFNTGRILVPESQAVNKSLKPTETLTNPESSKNSEAEYLTPLPPLKTLQGASPSSEMLMDEKINTKTHEQKPKSSNPGSSSKILKAKAKPFPPCTHCGFNDHIPDDYRKYPECEICGKIHVEALYTPPLTIMNLITLKERHIRGPNWYLDSGCSRSMTGVKSYLHKYVEQLGPKVVFGDNSSCINEGYGSINYEGITFTKVAFVNGVKYNLISISQLCDAKYIVQFDDKQGTIFNANKKIILMAPKRNDVYILDMSSLTPNRACFFTKALESVNWLWHKRLSHLNFKNINKLEKQNKLLGLPSLVYSKDKPCSACEKGKHKRASFKTKQNFS
ncbi:retrovirus-related pol polyprotein from transposon TNT 1-94, partial [Tanacetum coccineum]